MILSGKELDAVPIEGHRLKQEGYLEAMLQCLCTKHQQQLLHTAETPCFYLEVGSRMNDGHDSCEQDRT